MQKSRKKHSKTQNCWFYNVNSAPELRNDRKSPKKKIPQSRFSDPFFWRFLVISGLGSRIYIVKSAILSFWVFLSTFLHEITLKAIDIDNIGCLEPFLPLWERFWNRVSVQLNCASDLTARLTLFGMHSLVAQVFADEFPDLVVQVHLTVLLVLASL